MSEHATSADGKHAARTPRALFALPLIAIVLGAWGISSRLDAHTALAREAGVAAAINVVTVPVSASDAGEELVLPGNVQSNIEAPIYARTSGYLKSWHTDIGAPVHKGQLLAEIDAPELDQQLTQAKAELVTAQATYALARTTDERWKNLLSTQSVSKQDADEKAGDAAAKKASVDSAAANLARLNELESFKRVVAPFDGVITARSTDIGALISAGQNAGAALFHLADTRKLRVYVAVPENDAAAARPGLKAQLHFAEHPGKAYPSEVVRTASALDPVARTLRVELAVDNADGELLPGSYVEAHFKLPVTSSSLRIPANTVLFRGEGLQVATVGTDSRVKLRGIVQGRDFGNTIEVLSGLTAGEHVVLNPPDSLVDGAQVRATARPPASAKAKS